MNRIKKKLRSRTGASVTFALLLFLVCAALCSVVLVAATAASGRMSGIAEMDQRYYAVTSASELMKELIDGKTVTVVEVTTSTSTTTYTKDGVTGPVDGSEEKETYLVRDKSGSQVSEADYTNQVDGTGFSEPPVLSTIPEDAAYRYYKETPIAEPGRTLSLSSSDGLRTALGLAEGAADPLEISMTELLGSDGTITITLKNAEGKPFQQKLVFSATASTERSTSSVDGDPVIEDVSDDEENVTYSIETTTTDTEKTTITWTLTSVS